MEDYVLRVQLYLGNSIRLTSNGTTNFTTINGVSNDEPLEVKIEKIGINYYASCFMTNGISIHVWCDDYVIECEGEE